MGHTCHSRGENAQRGVQHPWWLPGTWSPSSAMPPPLLKITSIFFRRHTPFGIPPGDMYVRYKKFFQSPSFFILTFPDALFGDSFYPSWAMQGFISCIPPLLLCSSEYLVPTPPHVVLSPRKETDANGEGFEICSSIETHFWIRSTSWVCLEDWIPLLPSFRCSIARRLPGLTFVFRVISWNSNVF